MIVDLKLVARELKDIANRLRLTAKNIKTPSDICFHVGRIEGIISAIDTVLNLKDKSQEK